MWFWLGSVPSADGAEEGKEGGGGGRLREGEPRASTRKELSLFSCQYKEENTGFRGMKKET